MDDSVVDGWENANDFLSIYLIRKFLKMLANLPVCPYMIIKLLQSIIFQLCSPFQIGEPAV